MQGESDHCASHANRQRRPKSLNMVLLAAVFAFLPLSTSTLPTHTGYSKCTTFHDGRARVNAASSPGFVGCPSLRYRHTTGRCASVRSQVVREAVFSAVMIDSGGNAKRSAVKQALQAAYGERDDGEFWAYRELAFEQVICAFLNLS